MRILKTSIFFGLLVVSMLHCNNSTTSDSQSILFEPDEDGSFPALSDYQKTLPLEKIKMPAGFRISVYAEIDNARSMAMRPSGVLYVGNRNGDKVYAVKDTDGDFKADKKWVIDTDLNMPNGVAFKDGDLYVAEVSRILKYEGIESKFTNPPDPVIVSNTYPDKAHHGWKYIAFGPDGKLYVPVGAPCNICESKDEIFATITRINADGTGREIFAKGVISLLG